MEYTHEFSPTTINEERELLSEWRNAAPKVYGQTFANGDHEIIGVDGEIDLFRVFIAHAPAPQ